MSTPASTKPSGDLPPGQRESKDFPRFGLADFAFRFPQQTDHPQIDIRGDVTSALTLGPDQLGTLPRTEQVSDLHCVTTWSRRALRWSGFRFRDVYEGLILPKAGAARDARFVVLRGQDGYRNSLPLEDLLAEEVLLADRLDGAPLGIEHGAPLRLVAPAHYGYKNVKHLRAIELWNDASHYRFPGVRVMDHPRARVALEERGLISARVLRGVYRPAIRPLAWLFRVALARHERERRG
jgi:DMSO/TMAO reductase YedYZ molybdopterin-dependent catalytic subunit